MLHKYAVMDSLVMVMVMAMDAYGSIGIIAFNISS